MLALATIANAAGAQVATPWWMSNNGDPATPRIPAKKALQMRRRLRFLLLLLFASALLVVWCSQPAQVTAQPKEQVFLSEAATRVRTEEHWIVADVGNGIAELIAFAATRRTPALARMQFQSGQGNKPNEYLFEMRLGGSRAVPVQTRFVLADYLWSPESFTPLARQLMREWLPGVRGTRSPVDLEMFVRLTTPTPDALVREDKRLSEALTQTPHDAELHEEAALLIGSFALRHVAGSFYDVRRELSRMTAHLALARALSDERGPAGDLAEALLNTLVGRQSAALEILPRLEQTAGTGAGVPLEAKAIWTRALTLRNTGDYRKLDQPEQASLLERLEYVRALHSSIDSTTASNSLTTFRAEKLAEWSELILSDAFFSVGEGHLWAELAVKLEIDEIASAYRQYHGKPLEDNEWSAALNAPAKHIMQEGQEQAHLEVMGWGSWAEMHQRQLCHVLRSMWDWLDDKLGVPDEAGTFWKSMEGRFSQLRLLPLVELEHDGDAEKHRAFQDRVRTLAQAHPDWVPFVLWPDFVPQPGRGAPSAPTPGTLMKWSWFRPAMLQGNLPYGTLYDCSAREKTSLNSLPAEALDKLKAIAPYNRQVLYNQLQRAKQYRATPDDYETQFATLGGYDLWSMQVVANTLKADADRYEKAFLPICRISPDHFIELGNYLVDHQRPEAAVKAYQSAIDQAPDRVYLSNNVCWLAKHYYEQGHRKEAFEVAEMAAQVYSAGGLRTMGTLLECDNQLREAEDYFNKLAQRYDHWGDLVRFYGRHRRDEAQFDAGFQRLIGKIFPQGQEPVSAPLSALPPMVSSLPE